MTTIPASAQESIAKVMEPERHYRITRITTWTVRPSSPLAVRKTAAWIRRHPKLAGIRGFTISKPRGHWEMASDLLLAGIRGLR